MIVCLFPDAIFVDENSDKKLECGIIFRYPNLTNGVPDRTIHQFCKLCNFVFGN